MRFREKPLTSHAIVGETLAELINYNKKYAQWVAEDCGLLEGKEKFAPDGNSIVSCLYESITVHAVQLKLNLHFFSWASLCLRL